MQLLFSCNTRILLTTSTKLPSSCNLICFLCTKTRLSTMRTKGLSKDKAIGLIHEAFKSVKLEIEDMEVNESYICTQYVIKSYKKLSSFRGSHYRKIENILPDYLSPYIYRLFINDNYEMCIELRSENQRPAPDLLPRLDSEEFLNCTAQIPIPVGETMDGRLLNSSTPRLLPSSTRGTSLANLFSLIPKPLNSGDDTQTNMLTSS